MPGGEWFGRDNAYESRTVDGESGVVAESGRWWSMRWWDGHYLERKPCGEFGDSGAACGRRHGHEGKHDSSPADILRKLYPSDYGAGASGPPSTRRRRTASETNREDAKASHRAYLEQRQSAAESATRGNMLSPAGKRAGVSPSSFFTRRRVPTRYASEELRDWLKANGPTLSQTDYTRQARGGAASRRGMWFSQAA